MRRFRLATKLAGLIVFVFHGFVQAHESRPLFVEIIETSAHEYTLRYKVPPSAKQFNLPSIHFPDLCTEIRNSEVSNKRYGPGGEILGQKIFRCEQGLSGKRISIRYPSFNPSRSTLLKFSGLSGEKQMVVLGPGEDTWTVPAAQTKSRVARDYTRMGVAHIWSGADHLLFLVCLIWIAGSLRRILVTITGFTLAHSITLALSALDLVSLPVPPIEAVIALSVVFLATEIAKDNRKTLTWQHPIAVSSSFGLLHGFGFAAVLNDIGLPQTEVVTGLLFFNIGVEIGQILFAGGVVLGLRLIGRYTHDFRMKPKNQRFFRRGVAYAVGSFASFWLVQRTMAFLG